MTRRDIIPSRLRARFVAINVGFLMLQCLSSDRLSKGRLRRHYMIVNRTVGRSAQVG
jgi:hypothetical protein